MTIYFLEIIEEQEEWEIERGVPICMLRIRVKDKAHAEELYKVLKKLFRARHRARFHKCYHDETPPRPCEVEEL